MAEEVLRFDPPVQQTGRVAHAEVEIGGVTMRRNQWLLTLLAAANRDPDIYPDPNRFDINREAPAEHLAFSGGIHYCLGSPLARMSSPGLPRPGRALSSDQAQWTDRDATRPDPAGPVQFPVTVR